jgi:hypothetical protein
MSEDPRLELVALFAPVLASIVEGVERAPITTPVAAQALAAALGERWPLSSSTLVALHDALRRGVEAGWLCDRGEPHARFSRIAKPSPATLDCSLDLVSLAAAATEHGHPRGEITLALPAAAADADARFDGHPPGWVVMPEGSRHVPTVTGGRMLLLYALPGGAVTWG